MRTLHRSAPGARHDRRHPRSLAFSGGPCGIEKRGGGVAPPAPFVRGRTPPGLVLQGRPHIQGARPVKGVDWCDRQNTEADGLRQG